MTKKERILNAMNGKPVDRVPVSFYRHFFDPTDNTVAENIEWVKNTGMDMICIEVDGYYGLVCNSPMQTLQEWKDFRPYKRTDPFIERQLDRAKRIADGLQDDAAVYYMAFTPFAFFKHTLGEGQTRVMEFWNLYRPDIIQVLDVLEETNFIYLDELKKAGLDGMFVSIQHGEKWRMTPEEYRHYLQPYDDRLIKFINANYQNNIGHLCSWATMETNACINFDLYRDYDFQTMNWGVYQREGMTMAQGKQFFTKSKAVMGGFDRNPEGVLFSGTETQIKAFTKRLIRETGDVGFILSADCSIMGATPDQNIRAVVAAAEEYAAAK